MFVSMIFPIFLGGIVTLFFLLPVKWRPLDLLSVSYALCVWLDVRALGVLVLVSIGTWAAGRVTEKALKNEQKSKAKVFVCIVIGFFVFMLCICKYRQAVPIGLSFYLFQAIGYLADVYREKSRAEKSFLYLGLYLAFFPKLISGPIEREQEFLPQIKALATVKFWDRGRLSTAFSYLLWGYFMKMVVADRLAMTVNQIFNDPAAFDSFWLIAGALFYTMQIYCDFAGYSYIAIGCAGIFGIRLTHNFEAPYLANSISDFWHRWHISLSRWLRDYLYIPLGGNRKGTLRKCVNTVIVFLVCGLWHGAGINFLIWGLLHGIYSVTEIFWKKRGWKVWGGQALTFISVAFAWIFFKADSFKAAIFYIGQMFTAGIRAGEWEQMTGLLPLNTMEIVLIIIGTVVIWSVDILCSRKQMNLPLLIQQKQNAARYLIFYILILAVFIFGMYGPGYHVEQFIYMQF